MVQPRNRQTFYRLGFGRLLELRSHTLATDATAAERRMIMAYNEFPRKEYGRIFVEKESDIPIVKEIIRKMDGFEYGYLPEDLIAVFDPNIKRFPDMLNN